MSYTLSEEQQNHLTKILNFKGPNILFVTGSAGCGKSTLLKAAQRADENTIVLAPTGIAAIQANGQTIHSFFGLKPNSSTSRMRNDAVSALKNANRILLDEISMVRSDLMELMSSIMQSKLKDSRPFGGVPVIAIGDQSQIEPVVKEDEIDYIVKEFGGHFFFDAPAVKANPIEIIKLNTIYRQQGETEFIEALQALRTGRVDKLQTFNNRINVPEEDCLRVTYTNNRCSLINESKLKKIESNQYVSRGVVDGEFLQSEFPAEEKFYFKLYARVMLLINNREPGNDYVNGDIGTIVSISPGHIVVQLDRENRCVNVEKYTWEKIAYSYEDGKLKSGVVGTYTQLPMKLAWAMTTHKCVPVDSRVFIKGKGLIKIKDTKTGDLIQSGYNNFVPIISKSPVLQKDTLLITTATGMTIKYSNDHQVIMCDDNTLPQKLEASDLKIGDYLVRSREILDNPDPILPRIVNNNKSQKVVLPETMNSQIAYLLGILIGDGCVTDRRDSRIDLTADKKDFEVVENFKHILKSFNIRTTIKTKNSSQIIYAHSKIFRDFLFDIGLEYFTAPFKVIPEIIWSSSIDSQCSFVRGLMDTDGSVTKKGNIRFTTSSALLARQLVILLQKLGIISTITSQNSRHHKVNISSSSLELYREIIGFDLARKNNILENAISSKKIQGKTEIDFIPFKKIVLDNHQGVKGKKISGLWRNNTRLSYIHTQQMKLSDEILLLINMNYFYDKIISIEKINNEEMIDIEVGGLHTFVCDGFLTHNCQGQTFHNKVHVELDTKSFAHGLLYVALSRATKLDNLTIGRRIYPDDIVIDSRVNEWCEKHGI
jgi:intein/homing endonuclease/energy-coupling factor transporter ATP-binding protein EcfA2